MPWRGVAGVAAGPLSKPLPRLPLSDLGRAAHAQRNRGRTHLPALHRRAYRKGPRKAGEKPEGAGVIRARLEAPDGNPLWVVGIDRQTVEQLLDGYGIFVHNKELIEHGWDGPRIIITCGEDNEALLETLTRLGKVDSDTLFVKED